MIRSTLEQLVQFPSTTHLLVIEFNDLIAVLLKMIQVLDLILVAFHGLSIGLLKVHIFQSIHVLLMVKHLIDLNTNRIISVTHTGSQERQNDREYVLFHTLLEPPRPIILKMKNCLPLIVMDSFEKAEAGV